MTHYPNKTGVNQETDSLEKEGRRLVRIAAVMVPPTGVTIPLEEGVLIHLEHLVVIEEADHMCSVPQMEILPPDLRRDNIVAIETVDVIGLEIEVPLSKEAYNALDRTRALGLVLSVKDWVT